MKLAIVVGIASLLAVFAVSGYAEAFTVTDAMSRVVGFAEPPQRIVIAGKASFMVADAVYLFPEARQRVVARSSGMISRQGSGDFLARVTGGQTEPVTLLGNAGVEPIASVKPDAALLKSSSVRLGDELERVGIPVVYVDFETPEQYERDLAVLGRLLGAENRARSLISYFRDLSDTVQKQTAPVPAADKPRTLLIQYSERSGVVAFSVPPSEWIQTQLIERAGGVPVWKAASWRGGWTIVNLEQIAAWDPDIVFVVNYAESANQAVAEIRADTKWQALRATRENKVFAFPGDFCSWDQPDPRWGLGLLWLATRTYSNLFADVSITREIFRFYALYGLNEEFVRTHIIPLIREDIAHVQK